jgi:transcriptional regulator
MTTLPDPFAPPSEADVTRLVVEHPFAWVVTAVDGEQAATPLPLRPVLDANGTIVELLGHFARRNPHVELARRGPSLVLFMGPHGYISSSWLADRTRTPTWNYATVQYVVDLEFLDDDVAITHHVLNDLIGAMETGRDRPWSMDEMGARRDRLITGIVAFRAHLRERRVKFKLGQDERDSEYSDIVRALQSGTDGGELLEWMQRSNEGRTG